MHHHFLLVFDNNEGPVGPFRAARTSRQTTAKGPYSTSFAVRQYHRSTGLQRTFPTCRFRSPPAGRNFVSKPLFPSLNAVTMCSRTRWNWFFIETRHRRLPSMALCLDPVSVGDADPRSRHLVGPSGLTFTNLNNMHGLNGKGRK